VPAHAPSGILHHLRGDMRWRKGVVEELALPRQHLCAGIQERARLDDNLCRRRFRACDAPGLGNVFSLGLCDSGRGLRRGSTYVLGIALCGSLLSRVTLVERGVLGQRVRCSRNQKRESYARQDEGAIIAGVTHRYSLLQSCWSRMLPDPAAFHLYRRGCVRPVGGAALAVATQIRNWVDIGRTLRGLAISRVCIAYVPAFKIDHHFAPQQCLITKDADDDQIPVEAVANGQQWTKEFSCKDNPQGQ